MREQQLQPRPADEESRPPPEESHGAKPLVPKEEEPGAPVTWLPPDED